MSPPLRSAARALRDLRVTHGDDALQAALARLPTPDLVELTKVWELTARESQLRPDKCAQIWLILAGRGFGKTRAGAEWVVNEHEDRGPFRGALIAKNADDMRATMIGHPLTAASSIYEPQGLQAVCERRGIPFRHIENRGVAYIGPPDRQTILRCYGAHQADFGRGDGISLFWADEIAAWPTRAASHFKTGFLPSLRAKFRDGTSMRGLITTTPRPNEITKWLLGPAMRDQVTLVRGTSLENQFVAISAYANSIRGSREWLQEYEAILLDSGQLLTQTMLDGSRVPHAPTKLSRIVVGLDPGLDNSEDSDPTGIVVAGIDPTGHAYVLEDLTAGRLSFTQWGAMAIDVGVKYANTFACPVEIVAEINQGGRGGVIAAINAAKLSRADAGGIVVSDVHASVSKRARAEPVATLFETNRAHMVGRHYALEQEWTTWTEGAPSPNRLDACVYALHALLLRGVDTYPVWSPFE